MRGRVSAQHSNVESYFPNTHPDAQRTVQVDPKVVEHESASEFGIFANGEPHDRGRHTRRPDDHSLRPMHRKESVANTGPTATNPDAHEGTNEHVPPFGQPEIVWLPPYVKVVGIVGFAHPVPVAAALEVAVVARPRAFRRDARLHVIGVHDVAAEPRCTSATLELDGVGSSQ